MNVFQTRKLHPLHTRVLANWLLAILLLAAFALRLHQLTLQNIWWDEARNIDVALRPFWSIPTAPELDIQPPIYYWLLHSWLKLAGVQRTAAPELIAFFSRFFSVGWGVLVVALIVQLARRVVGPDQRGTAGLVAGIFAGLSPFWLAESQEARMYTLSFALLTAAAIAFLDVLPTENNGARTNATTADFFLFSALVRIHPRPIKFWAFVVLSALALLTHYNAVFILAAWYSLWLITVLWRRDRQSGQTLLLAGLGTSLLILPMLSISLGQIIGYENPNLIVPTIAEYLTQNWNGYLGGYAWTNSLLWQQGQWWLWATFIVLVIGLILLNARRSAPRATVPFLLSWLIGGLVLYYIAVLDRGAFNIRYSSFVTPALYVLAGVAVAGWARLGRLAAGLIGVAICFGLGVGIQADLTDARFFREDTSGLAQWLQQNAGPEDLILVDQKYPLGFYYQRFAIDPNQRPTGPEAAPARYLFVDADNVDDHLNEWATEAQTVYWVQWFESDTDPRKLVSFLLNQSGERVDKAQFRGYDVRWWQMQPPNQFALAETLAPANLLFHIPGQPGGLRAIAFSAPTQMTVADRFSVVIRWQSEAEAIKGRLTARVALYDSAGNRVGQDDRRILNDRHLTPAEWQPVDRPINVYSIQLPENLSPGSYEARLLVYDTETLAPLEWLDTAGNPAGIEPILGPVEITNND